MKYYYKQLKLRLEHSNFLYAWMFSYMFSICHFDIFLKVSPLKLPECLSEIRLSLVILGKTLNIFEW